MRTALAAFDAAPAAASATNAASRARRSPLPTHALALLPRPTAARVVEGEAGVAHRTEPHGLGRVEGFAPPSTAPKVPRGRGRGSGPRRYEGARQSGGRGTPGLRERSLIACKCTGRGARCHLASRCLGPPLPTFCPPARHQGSADLGRYRVCQDPKSLLTARARVRTSAPLHGRNRTRSSGPRRVKLAGARPILGGGLSGEREAAEEHPGTSVTESSEPRSDARA